MEVNRGAQLSVACQLIDWCRISSSMFFELFFGPHVQISMKKPQNNKTVVFFFQSLAFSFRILHSLTGNAFTLVSVPKLVTKHRIVQNQAKPGSVGGAELFGCNVECVLCTSY